MGNRLFVSLQDVPDLQNADYANRETNTRYHQLDIPVSRPGQIFIGVYGSPFDLGGPTHPAAHYKLTGTFVLDVDVSLLTPRVCECSLAKSILSVVRLVGQRSECLIRLTL